LAGCLSSCRWRWFKNALISLFSKAYKINWAEAQAVSKHDYVNFNDFFTRSLKPDARPIKPNNGLISPCDGTLSEHGNIKAGHLLQAKHISYPLHHLLACTEAQADIFSPGYFSTIYLAPSDYHRVHMPLTGQLTHCTHVPGRLFSVSLGTANNLPGLFCRNERVICWFTDTHNQAFAIVMVGAMMVGSITTVWHGRYAHRCRQTAQTMPLPASLLTLQQGDELGRFMMGSTVILVTARSNIKLKVRCGERLKTGQTL